MAGGRPKALYSQALRILQIYEMLQHRGQLTIADLTSEFGVERRTIQRDMGVLSEAYAIEEGERTADNCKTFRLRPGSRTETLKCTQTEIAALYMGRNLFAFTEGTELKKATDSVYEKLAARLVASDASVEPALPKKFYCTAGFPKSYAGSGDVLNDVLTGLLKEREVAVRYKIPGRTPYDDVIHPYTLVVHNRALYVIGYSERAGDKRMLALDRIQTSKWLRARRFVYPQDHDPGTDLAAAFGITAGREVKNVRLLFTGKTAEYVVERSWHPSTQCRRRRDGGVELTMRVSVSEELLQWIMGYGGSVQVLAPKALRDDVRRRHKDAVRAHG